MKFILGKKLDMTQVWQDGKMVGVTRVQAGPCTVVQVKTDKQDGYRSVQIGYGEKKEKNIKKPQVGHLKKLRIKNEELKINLRYLREFRISDAKKDLKTGDVIDVSSFEAGDKVKVTGVSKGKGFQGVVKRHGFHGQDKTHGTKDQHRMPGSAGATGPAHVFKGQKMPGRMGGDKVSIANLEIAEVDKKNNILLIKGAVPGARNGLVLISGSGELKVVEQGIKIKKQEEQKHLPAEATALQAGKNTKTLEKAEESEKEEKKS